VIGQPWEPSISWRRRRKIYTLPDTQVENAGGAIDYGMVLYLSAKIRRLKSPVEIENLRAASALTGAAIVGVMKKLRSIAFPIANIVSELFPGRGRHHRRVRFRRWMEIRWIDADDGGRCEREGCDGAASAPGRDDEGVQGVHRGGRRSHAGV
jgi:hypothetical protein